MKRILILVFSNLKHDARVRRQVNALASEHNVTIVCFDADPSDNYTIVRIDPTPLTLFRKAVTSVALTLRLHGIAYRLLHDYSFLVNKFRSEKFNLIVANDIEALPLGFAIDPSAKVLFDAHEYAPRHFEDKWMWRFFFQHFNIHLCRKYIPRVAAMTTVGSGLATEYEKNFGVKPVVITNANNYFDLSPAPVKPGAIRLVHHGIANRSRRLELMMELMRLLDNRFTLDLMLLVPGSASKSTREYIDELKARYGSDGRIRFIPAVKSHEVVPAINNYDIGVFLLPPINFNYENTLPNKLFDFIQARLGVAIGPTPEMAAIVNRYGNGVVSADFTAESLAEKLNNLTEKDIALFKTRSGEAAKELNAEKNNATLLALVRKVLGS